jgi:hypothetical protein
MADPDDIWTEALQEAYASAPSDEVILHTLELRHPAFPDTSIRVVMDHGEEYVVSGEEVDGHFLGLEVDAPVQAGQVVFFQACMFSLTLPDQKEGSLPTIEVELDNVTRLVMEHLDAAIGLKAPMELTYREYIASDMGEPQFILGGLTLKEVKSNLGRVTGTAQFSDLVNKSFPKKLYRPSEFQGLVQ